jgi:hypothetical protein
MGNQQSPKTQSERLTGIEYPSTDLSQDTYLIITTLSAMITGPRC